MYATGMQLQACYQLQYLSVMNDFQISHLAYIPKYLYWLSVFWEAWSNMTIAMNFRTRRADSESLTECSGMGRQAHPGDGPCHVQP